MTTSAASKSMVMGLGHAIAQACLAHLVATKERLPAKDLRQMAELVAMLDAAARGDDANVDAGYLASLASVAVDLSQRPKVKERALLDAMGASAYAADALLSQAVPTERDLELATVNLARAYRGATACAAIEAAVREAADRHEALDLLAG